MKKLVAGRTPRCGTPWTTGGASSGATRALKDDKDVTEADIAAHNLILWGDPASNSVLAKIAGKLPVQWDKDVVRRWQ